MPRALGDGAGLARRTLLTMGAIALTFAGGAGANDSETAGTPKLPPDLAKAVRDYDRATVQNDVATLDRLVDDDYLLVNSDSSLQDKQSYLDDFNVPGFKLDPYVVEEPVLKVWEGNALTGGLVRLSWTLGGQRETRLLRIAHVWVKHDGQWRLTYTQLTRQLSSG